MGKIVSAATVTATAYLTEKGRTYLFNKNNVRFDSNGNDLFEISTFTLGDPDTNYRTEQLLQSGDIPDATGKSEGILKSVADYSQTIFAYYAIEILSSPDPLYMTDSKENTLIINTDSPFLVNTDNPPTIPTTFTTGVIAGKPVILDSKSGKPVAIANTTIQQVTSQPIAASSVIKVGGK